MHRIVSLSQGVADIGQRGTLWDASQARTDAYFVLFALQHTRTGGAKGGQRTFAALWTNGSDAQGAGFAKFG